MKKLLSAAIAMLALLGLISCRLMGDPEAAIDFLRPESLRFDASLHLTLEASSTRIPLTGAVRGEMTREPRVFHGTIRAGLQSLPAQMEIYTEEAGEDLLFYTGVRSGSRTVWRKYRGDLPPMSLLDGPGLLTLLGENRNTGMDKTADGTRAQRGEGTITAQDLQKMLKALMLLEGFRGKQADHVQKLLDHLDPELRIPYVCLRDPELGHLLELRVDLTDTVTQALKRQKLGNRMKVPEFTFRLTLRDHNQVEPIRIPPEARTAS